MLEGGSGQPFNAVLSTAGVRAPLRPDGSREMRECTLWKGCDVGSWCLGNRTQQKFGWPGL